MRMASPPAPIGGRELFPPGFGGKTAAESGNCMAWQKNGLSLPGNHTIYKERVLVSCFRDFLHFVAMTLMAVGIVFSDIFF